MIRIISALFLPVFVCGQLLAATISAPFNKGVSYETIYLTGETIPTSSYVEAIWYGIAGYSSLDFKISNVSGGSGITTANISWKVPKNGSTVEISSQTLTSGTPITAFKSDIVGIRIYSNRAASTKVTGNILLRGVR